MRKENWVIRTSVVSIIINFISRGVGLLREIMFATILGIGIITDSFLVARTICTFVVSLLIGALVRNITPLYIEIDEKKGNESSLVFFNNIINIYILVMLFLCIISFVFMNNVVKIFAVGFEGEALKKTIYYSRIMIFSSVFIGLNYLFKAYLNIKKSFWISELTGIPSSIILMISIILVRKYSDLVLPYGELSSYCFQFIILLCYSLKKGYRYNFSLDLKDNRIKILLKTSIPILLGSSAYQINSMIDKTMASTLGEGIIGALSYSWLLITALQGIIITPYITIIYPDIARSFTQNKIQELKETLIKSIELLFLVLIPIVILLLVWSEEILNIIFYKGKFSHEKIKIIKVAIQIYSLGILNLALIGLFSNICLATKKTKILLKSGILSTAINIIINFIVIKKLGYIGLAFSTVVASFINMIYLMFQLNKSSIKFEIKKYIKEFFKFLSLSIISISLVLYFDKKILINNSQINFIKNVIVYAGIYSVLCLLFFYRKISNSK